MIPHETKFASALMAYFHDAISLSKWSLPKRQSPDDKRDQPSNEGDGCEGRDNPQIDQCDTCLSHNVLDHRPSGGETEDARFEFGHLIEPDKIEPSAERMPFASTYCSASQIGLFLSYRKMPVILGVNVNSAARIQALTRRLSVTLSP